MSTVVSATEARVHFGELLRRVAEGRETVFVERGGQPRVVVLAVSEYERLVSAGDVGGWRERARAARERIHSEVSGEGLPPAEDLIRRGREERDEQLDSLR